MNKDETDKIKNADELGTLDTQVAYSISSPTTEEHYCNLVLSSSCIKDGETNQYTSGEINLNYYYISTELGNMPPGEASYGEASYNDKWTLSESIYALKIFNFVPPVCLRGLGISTFAWSQIQRCLSELVKSHFVVSGTLSSEDSEIPLTNEYRRQVIEWCENGISRIKMVNNETNRNKFWNSMLDHTDKRYLFEFNESTGYGRFEGIFIDPCPNYSSLRKIKIVAIDPLDAKNILLNKSMEEVVL